MLLGHWQARGHARFPGELVTVLDHPLSEDTSEPGVNQNVAKALRIRWWASVIKFSLSSFPLSFCYTRTHRHSYNLSIHRARRNSNPPRCELKTQQPMQSLEPISSVSGLTSVAFAVLTASNWVRKRWSINGLDFCPDLSWVGSLIL